MLYIYMAKWPMCRWFAYVNILNWWFSIAKLWQITEWYPTSTAVKATSMPFPGVLGPNRVLLQSWARVTRGKSLEMAGVYDGSGVDPKKQEWNEWNGHSWCRPWLNGGFIMGFTTSPLISYIVTHDPYLIWRTYRRAKISVLGNYWFMPRIALTLETSWRCISIITSHRYAIMQSYIKAVPRNIFQT